MKRMMKTTATLIICLMMVLGLAACAKEEKDLWADAKYTEDTAFGEGSKTLKVVVGAGEKEVLFTIATDAATVGEALLEHELIAGDEGEYGLYIKEVNGIQADYDVDKAYWGFYQNGEYMMTGVDLTEFADGDQYEFVYTKE